jgi:hypothetical protein
MRGTRLASLGIVTIALALSGSLAHATPNQSATYVTGGTVSVEGVVSGGVNVGEIADSGVGIGGFGFAASTKPVKVKISDAVAGPTGTVGFTACQVITPGVADVCGQSGTVTQLGCANSSGVALDQGTFVAGKPLTIFIHEIDSACEFPATTGTITVIYN